MTFAAPGPADVDAAVTAALAEDMGTGDITTDALVPADATLSLIMAARQDIVAAGLPVAREVFRRLAPAAALGVETSDGTSVSAGTVMMRIEGPARGLLSGERVALNFVQVLSGIATLTRAYVQRIAGTGAVLLDTRKTVPGLRALSKYATALGGARNHRLRLDDGVLIKDNHIAVCGGVEQAVARARAAGLTAIEVECDTIAQVTEALGAGAGRILESRVSSGIPAVSVVVFQKARPDECPALQASLKCAVLRVRYVHAKNEDSCRDGTMPQFG
ncbi:MAG: carboxylating nicotinate-nucleotide diphosphorylase [Proteobacteria bacterium]|nr:carboxylating nicotinate-nucleotide diphosphorylase [Pseudomonadota bacterium]